MKKLSAQKMKKYGIVIAIFFLMQLAVEEVAAQVIANPAARVDVRATSRRTARRVDRRQDVIDAPAAVVAPAAVAAPVATAAAVTATAAVLYALPAGCIDRSGIFDCNGVRYRPQYQGADIVYIKVD